MDKNKRSEIKHYTGNGLRLSEDVAGARQWAVSLDRVMLTYFEVEPHCRFEPHNHESEQITLVLEGVLYFEEGDKIIEVGKGDVIAIPSKVQHAVFTKNLAARAVDAWSPIMKKYKQRRKDSKIDC
jgi:quercetin dioxygenase-like cupin family protein